MNDNERQRGKQTAIAAWVCRACFAFVFIMNVQCAFSYIFMPESFAGGFQLSGIEGAVAVQGIGVAFLMWNATYPAFIARPQRFCALGVVILFQQAIGLVGECVIYLGLPEPGYTQLANSIARFVVFDAVGLAIMVLSFIALCVVARNKKSHSSE